MMLILGHPQSSSSKARCADG